MVVDQTELSHLFSSSQSPHRRHIGRNLRLQLRQTVELHLWADALHEREAHLFAVDVAVEVKQVRFDSQGTAVNGRPQGDVGADLALIAEPDGRSVSRMLLHPAEPPDPYDDSINDGKKNKGHHQQEQRNG